MNPNATINVSVSSHYREADYGSEIVSQGLLGERVEIIKPGQLFSLIRQADGYSSWISSDQLADDREDDGDPVTVTSHFLRILEQPSEQSHCVRDAVIGCTLRTVGEKDDWYELRLPDGTLGWARKHHFGTFGACSANAIISAAKQFLGYQYTWGGRSPKGFDCSGFTQTVFGLFGIHLARDSWQQQQQYIVSTDFREARPADLLFFARNRVKVTHVALSLGEGRFIHASGWVKFNSLNEADADFSQQHVDTFISVNRYPLQ